MTVRRVRAVFPLALLGMVVLAGCGSTGSDGDPAEAPPPAGASSAPAGAGQPAVSVRVVQSGGLTGVDSIVDVGVDTPGSTSVLVRAGRLDEVGNPAHTEIPCCDLARYVLTIRQADGSTTRVVTFDGDRSPAYALVRAVQRLVPSTAGTG